MAVLMRDTAYVSHLQGRTMQNKPPVFDIQQKDKLLYQKKQTEDCLPYPFKDLSQSVYD